MTMDRPIDVSVRRRRLAWRLTLATAGVAVLAILAVLGADWLRPSVRRSRIHIGVVDRGDLEATVQASGVVIPADEHVLSSPVEARVRQVLRHPGDRLQPGDRVLDLDVASSDVQLDQVGDQLARKRSEQVQLEVELEAALADLAGRIESQRLELELADYRLKQRNRLHLEGLISEEELRQAELTVGQSTIALRRLDEEIATTRRTYRARLDGLALDASILKKQHDALRRQLDLAAARVERGGVLTWVVPQAGMAVRAGEQIARIADLETFRIEATVSDAYASRLAPGQSAHVVIDGQRLPASVVTILPAIDAGSLRFLLDLETPNDPRLRQNLRVDVHVVTARRAGVLRLPRGPYAQGGGLDQQLFVIEGDVARRVQVRLGSGSHEHVEAVEGLSEGDQVVLSDMADYVHARELRIR
jgi:HlyD family secretion protein